MWNKKFYASQRKEHLEQERVLNTYVDKGVVKMDPTPSSGSGSKLPVKLEVVKVEKKQVALADEVAQSANRIAQAAIVESGQGAIYDPKEDAPTDKGKEEEVPFEDTDQGRKEPWVPDESLVELENVYQWAPVDDMQTYKLRDDRDQLFFRHLEVDECVPDTLVSKIPNFKDILSYATKLENGPKYYESITKMVVNSKGANFPQLEVVNRRYIQQFLRAPTKGVAHERPCGMAECESLRLSSQLLEKHPQMRKEGLQRGFRCREFLLPNEYVKVRAEEKKGRSKGGDPSKHLSTYPQPCYLCHLALTNAMYLAMLNRRVRDYPPEESDVPDSTCIIHRFVVVVDLVGEYRMKDMLVGDNQPTGIIGPFPRYNVNNYAPYMDQLGRCGWREADKLVFRLPEQTTGRTEPQDTSSGSTPSDRTAHSARGTASLQ